MWKNLLQTHVHTTVSVGQVHPRKWSGTWIGVLDKSFMSLMGCLPTVHTHTSCIQCTSIHGLLNPLMLHLLCVQLLARGNIDHWESHVTLVANCLNTKWLRGLRIAIDMASPRIPHITGGLQQSWWTCLIGRTINSIILSFLNLIWLGLSSHMHHTLMPISNLWWP